MRQLEGEKHWSDKYMQMNGPDWHPGRVTNNYRDGHVRTFGEQNIFKNLQDKEADSKSQARRIAIQKGEKPCTKE